MSEPHNILVVEDSKSDFLLIERHLKEHGLRAHCRWVARFEQLREAIETRPWDAVLFDYRMPELDFHDGLKLLQVRLPEVPVILVSGVVGEEKAVDLLKLGLSGFVLKDNLARLPIVIERSLREAAAVKECKRAEEALRASERQLSLIYANISDVVYFLAVEPEGRFRFITVNAAFLKTTGLKEDQIVGKEVEEVVPAPARALVLEKYREAIRLRKTVEWEEVSEYLAGRKFGEVAITPIFEADGRCTRLIGVVHDITESKRAEEEIRRLNADLERRVRERTVELEAANKELETFSYSVSHDLRAPLRAMDGFSRIALTQHLAELSPAARDALHVVREGSQQMGRLIDELLAFSRLSRQIFRKETVRPGDIVRECLETLRPDTEGRRVEIVTGDLPPCLADFGLLKLVWMNLLSNALKYTRGRDPARIEVGCRQDGEAIYFVRDNGVGFNMAYADKLFGVFQRLHRAEDFEGTGVGLATAQRIVHRHGGRIWAEAELDRGATFHFTLEPPKKP